MSEAPCVAARLETGSSGAPLVPEVQRSACQRLAWVALCYSVGYALAFGEYWVRVVTHHAAAPDLFSNAVAALSIVVGLVVFVRVRRCVPAPGRRCGSVRPRLPSVAYENLAIGFQIFAAFGIFAGWGWGWQNDLERDLLGAAGALGISETNFQAEFVEPLALAREPFFEFLGVNWVGVWIIFFPLLVPSEPRKSTWAAVLAASTVPAVMLASLFVSGIPEAARPWVPEYLTSMIVPVYICAVFAIVGSRVVYRLSHELSRARRMGSYRLVERLGVGGMGEVWRAEHRMLARPSAIKIIRPETLGGGNAEQTATALKRFEREAQATAMLASPHTVDLYDFGTTDEGDFYYVMELLDGIDLRTLVEKYGAVPARRAVHFLRQACHSLEEAHARGLVHRDIKPANLFTCRRGLEYDVVKVLDFGLVKKIEGVGDGEAQITAAGIAPGTPSCMSPEMAAGTGEFDARVDIYALGCVAYWLLTGEFVFEGESPMAIIVRHVRDVPVRPSLRSELEIPEDLERVVMSCLEKDPRRRPRGAAELSRRLGECEKRIGPWTQEHAEHWWQVHTPAGTTAERIEEPTAPQFEESSEEPRRQSGQTPRPVTQPSSPSPSRSS